MTPIRVVCAVVLLAALATVWDLQRPGVPPTALAWFSTFCIAVIFISFATGFIAMAWWILWVNATIDDDEGWQERYRQALSWSDPPDAYKTARTIAIVSFGLFYAALCAGVIAGQPSKAPIPSYFDVDALPR